MEKITHTARQLFEDYIREQVRTNVEEDLLPSENRIAGRLLDRGGELAEVYDEAYAQLKNDGVSWKVFLNCLLSTAAFWSPEKLVESRGDRDELVSVNRQIAKQAHQLADLLAQRDDLNNRSAFSSGTHYDICEVIAQACKHNGRFESYVKEPLSHLNARFDEKYWPSLSECLLVIADDAQSAKITATDPMTEAGTKSTRASKADFIRALREAIDENRGTSLGTIPTRFVLSNDAMATLVNVLLDLTPEELVDASYVKNIHRRDK